MPAVTVWMLESAHIKISRGGSLSGKTQGDGSHLLKSTIVLEKNAWIETRINDDDKTFDDNDGTQKLAETQMIDGAKVTAGTVIEAEYRLTLHDPETGKTYEVFGYNINNTNPTYATVEGLAFLGGRAGFPPIGVKLQVIATAEGPGAGSQKAVAYDQLASPPCLTPGTMIATPQGDRLVEGLRPGDRVDTLDHGPQPLIWVGAVTIGADQLATMRVFRPIRIRAGAMGGGRPLRDLVVSPQHRLLIRGWRAEMLFGSREVLVAARHLVNDHSITVVNHAEPVTYVQLLFDRHQLIWANGTETESFHPGAVAMNSLPSEQAQEILALFPILRHRPAQWGAAARPCLRRWEAAALAD